MIGYTKAKCDPKILSIKKCLECTSYASLKFERFFLKLSKQFDHAIRSNLCLSPEFSMALSRYESSIASLFNSSASKQSAIFLF